MGLPLSMLRALGVAGCVACGAGSPNPPRAATLAASHVSAPEVSGAPASRHAPASSSPAEWPEQSALFLVRTGEAELVLRAVGPGGVTAFEQVLAREVGNVLHNPELELVWYTVDDRLFVIDTHDLGHATSEPVLIARNVPIVGGLRVERGGVRFAAPGSSSDEDDLQIHWDEAPWIEGGEEKRRIENLDGRAWLDRERLRPVRVVPALQGFDPNGPRVALPRGRAACADPEICGAALRFGSQGWQLVVANEDDAGDFPEYGCLLHDPATRKFATPPEARSWAAAGELESGSCGPFSFNAEASIYLASDVVCPVGAACTSLGEGSAGIGWLAPGPVLGNY